MTNQNVANPIASNSGAVACADDTADLAQCLADRLMQNKQAVVDRSKKRHKAQDEGVAFMLFQPQQLLIQPALSSVLMQLTTPNGNVVPPETQTELASRLPEEQGVKLMAATSVVPQPMLPATRNISPDQVVLSDNAVNPVRQTRHTPSVPSALNRSADPQQPLLVTETTRVIRTKPSASEEQADKVDKAVILPHSAARATSAELNPLTTATETVKQANLVMQAAPVDVLNQQAIEDSSPVMIRKTITLDVQADQVAVRYNVADHAIVRLQVAEQVITPASSNHQLSNMLVGQTSLATFEPGWSLHGLKQARPYYLASSGSSERVKDAEKAWKERDQ